MNINQILHYIIDQWHLVSWLEIIAVTFGIIEVLLSYRNNILLYPAGIISCSLSIGLMLEAKLYAESGLSVYYLIMSFWGWYHWVKRRNTSQVLPISKANKKDWLIVLLICLGGYALIVFTLKTFTDSTVPFMDGFVSATAWAGMYLLAKRKIENWIVLNVSNIVAIPLLFYKHLPLMGCLTTFLFTVAIFGYFKWKKIMKEEARETVLSKEFDYA